MSATACYHLSSSNEDTKLDPEGVYKTLGYLTLDFSRPGKPTDNAFIESLNGRLRAECLNAHWFTSLDEMRQICEDWRRDYNEVRPHSAIGNKPPISLMNGSGTYGPP